VSLYPASSTMTTPMGPGNEFDRRGFLRLTGASAMAAGLTVILSACGGDNPNKKTSQGGSTSSGGVGNSDGTITAGISYALGTNGYDPMTTTAALTVAANWHTLEGLYEIEPTDPTKATLPWQPMRSRERSTRRPTRSSCVRKLRSLTGRR